ncbi:MAG TPA: bacterioferritin-associated ferredoxin [Gammaproteobacteria bacterium]
MYVCICNAVTDKQIRKAAREGCSSLRELSCRTACSTTCGKCARMAREILDDELQRLDAENREGSGKILAYPA